MGVTYFSDVRKLNYFALLLQTGCRKKRKKEKVPVHFLYFGFQITFLLLFSPFRIL